MQNNLADIFDNYQYNKSEKSIENERKQQHNESQQTLLQNVPFSQDAIYDSNPATSILRKDQFYIDKDNIGQTEVFTVLKSIAKIKKNRSKKFIRRSLLIEPIYLVKLKQHHQYMLYYYLQIEDVYLDFDSFDDGQLKDLPTDCQHIEKIERNLGEQGGVTIHVHSMVSSGIKDFQFLLNHFSRLQSPQYVKLYELLQLYQQKCIEQAQHLKELNLKLQTRIICEDEITQAIEQFHIYLANYIKNTYKDTDFIEYSVMQLNPETEDIKFKSVTISEAYINLLGFENQTGTMNGLQNFIYLTQLLGTNRLNSDIVKLKLLLGFEKSITIEQDILTFDNIQLSVSLKFGCIEWPNRPSWLNAWDIFAITLQVQIRMNQLEALLKIRRERASQKRQGIIGFEQQVQQEIFIEKFYPNLAQMK